jgi:hypothetical protein
MSVINESITIVASAGRIFDILLDVEKYPAWQPGIEKVEVVERDQQGRPKQSWMSVAAEGRAASCTLCYEYLEQFRFEYFMLDGKEMTRNDASYAVVPGADGTCEVTVTLGLKMDWPLSESELDALASSGMRAMLEALKALAEESPA